MTTLNFETMTTGTSRDQAAPPSYWVAGILMTVLASEADTGGRYDLIEVRSPAGVQTPPHRHTRYLEQLYMLDGESTVVFGRDRVLLKPGETFTVPLGAAHVVAATGNRAALRLVITSPSGFAHFVEEAGTPAGDGRPPELTQADLERLQRVAAEIGDELLGPPGALPEE